MKYNLWNAEEPTNEELQMMENGRFSEEHIEYDNQFEMDAEDSAEEADNKHVISGESENIGSAFKLYLNDLNRMQLLSAQEEQELGKIIAEGGADAREARNKLVEGNLKLAMYFAKKYIGSGLPLEDLNSMACEGLIKAAEKYDYARGYRFSTYASWWINQAISRGISYESGSVRKPVHMNENINKVKKAQLALQQKNSKEPTVEEIAEHTGLTKEKVNSVLEAMFKVVSLDVCVGEDGDTTLQDLISDENGIDPYEATVETERQSAIENVLANLDPREAKVLKLRYGIEGDHPMTLDEIGKLPEFKLSRERIRQIETKALRKIRRSPSLTKQLLAFAS